MSESPVVGIVMGSDSDWPVMEKAAHRARGVRRFAYEADVVSAHRMPEDMIDYGQYGGRARAAGDHRRRRRCGAPAGHARRRSRPCRSSGCPVPLTHLDGMDSLLSIVQMPAGVPVATVSIGGARNAGLLAARILGAGEGEEAARIRAAMVDFQVELRETAHGQGPRAARPHRGRLARRSRRRRRPAAARGYSIRGQVSMTTASPACAGAGRGRLVHDAQLQPDGGDAEPVLLGDRLVDDGADLAELTKQSTTWTSVPSGMSARDAYPCDPKTVSARGWTGIDAHTELDLEELGDRVGGRATRLVERPTTAQVARVWSRSRMTTGSLSYFVTPRSKHRRAGSSPPEAASRSR